MFGHAVDHLDFIACLLCLVMLLSICVWFWELLRNAAVHLGLIVVAVLQCRSASGLFVVSGNVLVHLAVCVCNGVVHLSFIFRFVFDLLLCGHALVHAIVIDMNVGARANNTHVCAQHCGRHSGRVLVPSGAATP